MADIGEFAQQAAEQFCQSQETFRNICEGRFHLGLPGPVVVEFVKAVFYASMIPDEGRYPTACLMSYRRDFGRAFSFPFCTALQPTAQEIAKLAHAVGPGAHLYALSDNGKLLLGGIHVTFLDELRHFGFASFRAANPLKLIIRGPGYIEVSNGGIALVYKAGVITEEELLQHSDIMRELAQAVEQELTGRTSGPIESLEDVFNNLAKAIVRLGHGGMLIVAKRRDLDQFTSRRPIESPLLQQLLIRYWDHVATLRAASDPLGSLQDEGVQQAVSPHFLTITSDTTMLENCVNSIGQLAGMDGAIVMDYACSVVAFNAIINKSVKPASEGRLVEWCGRPLTDEDVVKGRASRHQSALLYAKRVPDSFVFVISQDGGVTAFHNRGDGTVLCGLRLRVLD